MRFYNRPHTYYCGIDLHVKTMHVCVVDGAGQVLVHRNVPSTPAASVSRRSRLNRCWVPPPPRGRASAGHEDGTEEDGTEEDRVDSRAMPCGRASSYLDDRTEKICALDRGRADRGSAVFSRAVAPRAH